MAVKMRPEQHLNTPSSEFISAWFPVKTLNGHHELALLT